MRVVGKFKLKGALERLSKEYFNDLISMDILARRGSRNGATH